jgi:serine/threonine-protein kinase
MVEPLDAEPPKLTSLNYVVSSVLHTDPHGNVLLIVDKRAERGMYALKVLKREKPEDDLRIERARARFEASGKLHHPAILKHHDFRLRRKWFQVYRAEVLMEYVEGKSLDALKDLPIGASVLVFQKVAAALAHMHRRGVIHGDPRPSQVMLSRTGHVKVRGYGINLVGEPFKAKLKIPEERAAPELAKKGSAADEKSDIYGVGALMYQVLTGRVPGGVLGRTEGKKIPTPSALNAAIPDPLNKLIIECIQSKPDRRPPDMYEVVKRLEEMVSQMKLQDSELLGLTADEPK